MKKKQDPLMKSAKDTMKLGIATGVGGHTIGVIGGMSPAASGASSSAIAGLNLLNVGQLAKNAMTIADVMEQQKGRRLRKRKNWY